MVDKLSIKESYDALIQVMKKRIKRYAWTEMLAHQFSAMRGLLNIKPGTIIKPDIIIAGIPVWHITRLGHAASNEILKYRSMGGIFLAHQKGGKETFKFTAKLFGPARFAMVKLLELLLDLGSEQARDFMGLGFGGYITFADAKKNIIEQSSLKITRSDPLVEWSKQGQFDDQRYAYHRTYPIITETRIYTDMYMETMVIREDIKLGKDCIEVQCAFRQYVPPMEFQKTAEPGEGPAYQKEAKKKYYRTYIPREKLSWLKRMDFTINFSWAFLQFLNDYTEQKEWYKKESGKVFFEEQNLITAWFLNQSYQAVKYWRPKK